MSSLNESEKENSGSIRKRQYTRPNDEGGDTPKKRRKSSNVPTSSGANIRRLACPFCKKNPRRESSNVPNSSGANILRLACVLHKGDPRGHPKCANRSYAGMKYLMEHIYKCHIQQKYCTLCGDTFKDQQSRDNHIAVTHPGQRSDRPQDEPDGLDPGRELCLRTRPRLSPGLSDAEKWFTIFKIVWPDHPLPSSPYHEPEVCSCCAKISDLRGFVTGNPDTENFSKILRQSSDWSPESEALLREGLNHWLGDPSDQCAMLQNDVPEEIVAEDDPEASLHSILSLLNSSEPVPSNYLDDRYIPGSPSPITSAQPTSESREDTSYALRVPQVSTSLQASGTSDIPIEDNSTDLDLASRTIPNLDTVTDFAYSRDDFPEFAWLEDFVNDGGDDPSTHG